MLHAWRDLLARRFAGGERRADIDPTPLRDIVDEVWKRDLKSMRPVAPRTPAAFRQTMREWSRFLEAR